MAAFTADERFLIRLGGKQGPCDGGLFAEGGDDASVAALVHQVIIDNPDVVEDPNMIFVGEQFTFPSVGTPPADVVPVAPAAPLTRSVSPACTFPMSIRPCRRC